MDLLKKIFPLSFGANDVAGLVIKVIIYLVAGFVAGFVMGILLFVPIVGLIVALVCGLLDLYVFAGIVITFLDYFKVLK